MASGYSRLGGEGNGRPQRFYGTTNPGVGFAPAERAGTEFFQVRIHIIEY